MVFRLLQSKHRCEIHLVVPINNDNDSHSTCAIESTVTVTVKFIVVSWYTWGSSIW